MAISIVQTSAKQTGDGVGSKAFAFNGVVAGSEILVIGWSWRPGITVSCADDVDGAYQPDLRAPTANMWIFVFRLPNATAGDRTITVSFTGSSNVFTICAALEIAAPGGLVLDRLRVANGTSTAPSAGPTHPTITAEELVLGLMGCEANQASITVATTVPAWTPIMEELSFSSHIPGEADQKLVAAIDAYTAAWTLASSAAWLAAVLTYAELSSGGGGGSVEVPRLGAVWG
jgi:hypothetical protein